jgi:phosphohistidine phosphatase SixA
MQVVITRHASHRKGRLTPRGEHHVRRLARALDERGVQPSLVLTSPRPHALQSAELLARRIAGTNVPLPCGPLFPVPGNPGGFDHVVRAARAAGVEPGEHETIVLVGHEGRVSGLVVQLTGSRARPIPQAGAVAIEGAGLADLLKGRGTVAFRYPVVDHQEAALRPKVQSKMTVATFLAGFVSAALVTNLFDDEFSTAKQLAAVLLTVALALLIVTVYIYDELGMPEGYWGRGSRGRLRLWYEDRREQARERAWAQHAGGGKLQDKRLPEARWIDDDDEWWRAVADEHEEQLAQDGPLYTWMVATWTLVFTPALVLALAGFGVLIYDAGSRVTGVACAVGVLLALGWLALRRPPLGTD